MKPLSERQAIELGIAPKPRKRTRTAQDVEQQRSLFIAAALAYGLPEPVPEWHFKVDGMRNPYRVDWFFYKQWEPFSNISNMVIKQVALEIEGGAFRGHGHRSVGVFLSNIKKYNELNLAGICLLRATTDMVKSGECFELVKRAMAWDGSLVLRNPK